MAVSTNTFEGGTDQVAISTGNSGGASGTAASAVTPGTGGSIIYETAGAYRGTLSAEYTQPNAANLCWVSWNDGAGSSSGAFRFYIYLTGLPSAEAQFPACFRTTADANLVALQLTSAGMIRVTSAPGGSLSPLGTNALTTGVWYRIEMQVSGLNGTAGVIGVQAYVGDSGTAYESLSFTSVTSNALAGRVRYGKSSTATLASWLIDDVHQNLGSNAVIGPSAPPAGTPGLSWGYAVRIGT